MAVDFKRRSPILPPLTCNNTVSTVESGFWIHHSQDLKWASIIDSAIKKSYQRIYFLLQFKKFNLPQALLIQF